MSDPSDSPSPGERLSTLVESSRAGDRAAFEEVVRLTGRSLFARLYLETGDPHRAEDLAQETFLLAWKRLHDLQDARKFHGWLASIAHRVVIDAARYDARKKRWAAIWTGATPAPARAVESIKDRAATPSESAERDDERKRVLSALRSMPKEYREVLSLRYLAGADVESIAQQLDATPGSVRGLLQRGIKLLRETMETRSGGTADERG